MKPAILIACLAALLSACASEDYNVAVARQDDATCRKLGAVPQTQAYVDCRQGVSLEREAAIGTPYAQPVGESWVNGQVRRQRAEHR